MHTSLRYIKVTKGKRSVLRRYKIMKKVLLNY